MRTDPRTLTDQQVVVLAMAADMLAGVTTDYTGEQHALVAEIDRRYPGASDRMADHVTGHRMTSWETLKWVLFSWPEARRVMEMEGEGCPVCHYTDGTHWLYCPCQPYPIGSGVIVDGVAPGVIRKPPANSPPAPEGSHWVRMAADGHSYVIAEKRLMQVP